MHSDARRICVPDFDAAIIAAKATRQGLVGGLTSADPALWAPVRRSHVRRRVHWNRPTTGAAGSILFDGIGPSGNFRLSAYCATDHCADPVASFAGTVMNQSADLRELASIAQSLP